MPIMTIKQIKNKYTPLLDNLDLDLLIAHAAGRPRSFVLAHPEQEFDKKTFKKLASLLEKRIKGEPLAYLIGEQEFRGHPFFVNRHTLIPRPETEILAEQALKETIQLITNRQKPFIADLGTGSGCLITSLAIDLITMGLMAVFCASDVSKQALAIAQANANRLIPEADIKFRTGNLLKPLQKIISANKKAPIVITANLPYLTPEEIRQSPTIAYEPYLALNGGSDGLDLYRKLCYQLEKVSNPVELFCEIDPAQKNEIISIFRQKNGFSNATVYPDLAGYDRIVHFSLPER